MLLILTFLFFFLILTFHYTRKREPKILETLQQRYHILQKDNYLKEQLLKNKYLEYNTLKNITFQPKMELESLCTEKARCCGKK
jgi:hypothetical protein